MSENIQVNASFWTSACHDVLCGCPQANLGCHRLHTGLAALPQPAASHPEGSSLVAADSLPSTSGVFLCPAEQHQRNWPTCCRRGQQMGDREVPTRRFWLAGLKCGCRDTHRLVISAAAQKQTAKCLLQPPFATGSKPCTRFWPITKVTAEMFDSFIVGICSGVFIFYMKKLQWRCSEFWQMPMCRLFLVDKPVYFRGRGMKTCSSSDGRVTNKQLQAPGHQRQSTEFHRSVLF